MMYRIHNNVYCSTILGPFVSEFVKLAAVPSMQGTRGHFYSACEATSSQTPSDVASSPGNTSRARQNQSADVRQSRRTLRPPWATCLARPRRDMTQSGSRSVDDMEARANESVLCAK